MDNIDLTDLTCSETLFEEPWQFGQLPARNVTQLSSSMSTWDDLSSKDTASRARTWCFTINNPTAQDLLHLHTKLPTMQEFRFIIFQLEMGLESATRHVQGYVEFKTSMRFQKAKRMINAKAHLERRRGSQQQAIDYCEKTETRLDGPWRYGTPATDGQGKRTDLQHVKDAIEDGLTDRQLWEDHFSTMVRYHRGIQMYRTIRLQQRTWKTKLWILQGPPGTGKSKWCMNTFPDAYWKQRGEWWDQYQHEHVIIDDFYGWLPFDNLLRLADRYPLLVETKGGQAQFVAKDLVITSNLHPRDWYKNIKNFEALRRRIDVYMLFSDLDNYELINTEDI
jgi:hypothetical protein